jgi:sulfur carrier protein
MTSGQVRPISRTPSATGTFAITLDMRVTVNGEGRDVPEGATVRTLVEHLGLADGPVAVEVNRAVVPRTQHGARLIAAGDVIEVVHFVGGG